MDLARDKILDSMGDLVTARPIDAEEAEHFMECPACGGWIDCRDQAVVLAHIGPLPHPVEDATD